MTMHARPDRFVWTKIQAEAGEPIQNILRRKELERRAGNGLFWWGIGESKGAAIGELIQTDPSPAVLFSIMRSAAAPPEVESSPEGNQWHENSA